jgi:hypothetical protein
MVQLAAQLPFCYYLDMRIAHPLLLCLIGILALSLPASAAPKTYIVFTEGTLTRLDPAMKELELRQYICRRVCFPAEGRMEESYQSWVGEDTDSLRDWQVTYIFDGNDFTMQCEDWTDGSGSLEGRMWSWSKISFAYDNAEDGLHYSFTGAYSGLNSQRAGVVSDSRGKLLFLIKDESSVCREEEYAIMESIYQRIKQGFN